MGAGGIPSGGVVIVEDKNRLPSKVEHINSRYDLYVRGIRKQSRWFDAKGVVIRNRDYVHQDAHNNHTFPHDHIWTILSEKILPDGESIYFVQRSKDDFSTDYDNYN